MDVGVLHVRMPVPAECSFSRLDSATAAVEIESLHASELQEGEPCDVCRRILDKGVLVLGKVVKYTYFGASGVSYNGSCYSPTCVSCFMKDVGGFYSVAVAALVMEA